MSIYKYSVEKTNGETLSLETYRGKVMLIVNTANQCRFTYQFEDLQKIQDRYGKENFAVLAFPCDQFGNQNPEDAEETARLCKINYGNTFPIFGLVKVNGEEVHPLFNYLREETEYREFGKANMQERMLAGAIMEVAPNFLTGNNIRWNFTKFLVDAEGNVITRFEPTDSQLDIEGAIESVLHNTESLT